MALKVAQTHQLCYGMNMLRNIIFIALLIGGASAMSLPQGFVYLNDIDKTILQDMKYLTDDNFLGRPVKGYIEPHCILTERAANALAAVQKQLKSQGLALKVFDCYRPQTAVDDFIAWSENPADQKMKERYYPHINKKDFFDLGYTAKKSSHTRGSTVDLTIVNLNDNTELDMGTIYDFMDPLSHPDNQEVSETAYKNRMILREVMTTNGFSSFDTEWWHFTLINEPYPDTYFNFDVE